MIRFSLRKLSAFALLAAVALSPAAAFAQGEGEGESTSHSFDTVQTAMDFDLNAFADDLIKLFADWWVLLFIAAVIVKMGWSFLGQGAKAMRQK